MNFCNCNKMVRRHSSDHTYNCFTIYLYGLQCNTFFTLCYVDSQQNALKSNKSASADKSKPHGSSTRGWNVLPIFNCIPYVRYWTVKELWVSNTSGLHDWRDVDSYTTPLLIQKPFKFTIALNINIHFYLICPEFNIPNSI